MTTPIKRHNSLQPLSRDHHDGLLLKWKINKGISKGVEAVSFFDAVLPSIINTLNPEGGNHHKGWSCQSGCSADS